MELQRKKSWPTTIIRTFAVLNLLMGLWGLYALVSSVNNTLRYSPWDQDPPYYAQAYYARSAINLVFVILTILGGIYLWRVDWRGWKVCKPLFIGQIIYFFLSLLGSVLLLATGERGRLVSRALAASEGTGNMGTTLQTITGYPVIALIGLWIAYGKLRRVPTSTTSATSTASPSG